MAATTAPLLAVLQAVDVLEEGWIAQTAARFDRSPDLSFVRMTDSRRAGRAQAEETAEPTNDPGRTSERVIFRREMFQALGGFDEALGPCNWIDFWLRAWKGGFHGEVDLTSGGRVPAGNPSHSLDPGSAPAECLERLYEKHLISLGEHHESLLVGKERLLLSERERQEQLTERRTRLQSDAERLRIEIAGLGQELREAGRPRVDLGDLRRTSPISPIWGLERGIPLDRYYIHRFLDRHRLDIRGRVLEVKDAGYTRCFGDDRVSVVDVLDVDAGNQRATILADLSRANAIPSDTYDCFILTQTLGVIFDVASAISHVYRVLKPGGVLLCTAPAIGRVSYEEGLDGDYWRFTEASLRRLLAGVFPLSAFAVTGFGNVLASAAFLYGLAPDELSQEELDKVDPYFPVVYMVRARKPDATPHRASASRVLEP